MLNNKFFRSYLECNLFYLLFSLEITCPIPQLWKIKPWSTVSNVVAVLSCIFVNIILYIFSLHVMNNLVAEYCHRRLQEPGSQAVDELGFEYERGEVLYRPIRNINDWGIFGFGREVQNQESRNKLTTLMTNLLIWYSVQPIQEISRRLFGPSTWSVFNPSDYRLAAKF